MTSPIVGPTDLATYLGAPSIDNARATQIIGWAQTLCEAVISPLPTGAEAVVLDVAARAFTNPTNAQTSAEGPYSATFGPVSGGLWLTRQNVRALRNLAGKGGAFTIDTTPANAATDLPWWDVNAAFPGDWDVPA